MYGVRFGDAVLVSVPDEDEGGQPLTRHILIDVGNVLGGEGGQDALFQPVIEDVLHELAGAPLDLYVMTHEHLDHVQGLRYASDRFGLNLTVNDAWLTASAAPDYYAAHPEARKKMDEGRRMYEAVTRYVSATPDELTPVVQAMLLNNDYRNTERCVAYLRGMATHTHYVHRGSDLQGRHGFRLARFDLWAPEEDTSAYYGRFQPMAFDEGEGEQTVSASGVPLPPAGVDAGAFYNLVSSRNNGWADNLMAIDRAANNTSIVLALEWRGVRLLFAGDAERRSWLTMRREGKLAPVDFLKVSHHGSHTGLPEPEMMDLLLPRDPQAASARIAAVSTYPSTYANVPARELLEGELAGRCQVAWVDKGTVADGAWRDWVFAARDGALEAGTR
jgi:beta-lactamase superfamily II metal-dependent hydrolase